jgi:hypothetical protein
MNFELYSTAQIEKEIARIDNSLRIVEERKCDLLKDRCALEGILCHMKADLEKCLKETQ